MCVHAFEQLRRVVLLGLGPLSSLPAAAVVSTDEKFITFLKLRLEFVATGRFEAPSDSIPDALASAS